MKGIGGIGKGRDKDRKRGKERDRWINLERESKTEEMTEEEK